jgi:hypothetical protein
MGKRGPSRSVAERRLMVGALWDKGETRRRIAETLGMNHSTVNNDVAWLEARHLDAAAAKRRPAAERKPAPAAEAPAPETSPRSPEPAAAVVVAEPAQDDGAMGLPRPRAGETSVEYNERLRAAEPAQDDAPLSWQLRDDLRRAVKKIVVPEAVFLAPGAGPPAADGSSSAALWESLFESGDEPGGPGAG